jgi:required for meiotic nuclear division protein 1
MIRIEAYQIAEQINIKKFRAEFTATPIASSNWELFYVLEPERYLYILNYGVVAFGNYEALGKSELLRFLTTFSELPVIQDFSEDIKLDEDETLKKPYFKNSMLLVPTINEELIRITMLNTAQSVALDYYEYKTNEVIDSIKVYTSQLERYGKFKINKLNLMKFIGRTLNVKNGVVDNLYILDDPGITWEDEYLEQVNKGLKDVFDIQIRFRDLDYKLKSLQDNLSILTDILQHRESKKLEWVIILLILIEVLNMIYRELLS